jgi:hypothetical protein
MEKGKELSSSTQTSISDKALNELTAGRLAEKEKLLSAILKPMEVYFHIQQ